MKKNAVLLIIVAIAFSCSAQQKKEPKEPDEQIIVNKKYDEEGSLIQYDSTYVHKWSLDSTFHFGMPADSLYPFGDFSGIEQFMNKFWNDSVFGSPTFPHQPFSFGFRFSPFDDGDFFGKNRTPIPDSLFQHNFPYQFDSLFFNFGFDPRRYDRDIIEKFEKRFEKFQDDRSFPDFKNKEQMEEWQKLIEKQRKELEEFRRKWKEE